MKLPRLIALLLAGGLGHARAADALPASAHNFTVKLTITAIQTVPVYGDATAAEGHQFLVLPAEWANVIDDAFARSRSLPTRATNDNLAESLALVLDGRDSIPLSVREADTAHLDVNDPEIVGHSGGSTDAAYIRKVVGLKNSTGKRSLAYYDLSQPGETMKGDLLFEIPTAPARVLELRYHDLSGGDLTLRLAGRQASGANADAPDPAENEIE